MRRPVVTNDYKTEQQRDRDLSGTDKASKFRTMFGFPFEQLVAQVPTKPGSLTDAYVSVSGCVYVFDYQRNVWSRGIGGLKSNTV
jgi:hypothetical protein